MQIKATDEITLTDVTDAYSVFLSSDSLSFQCDSIADIPSKSGTFQVYAYRGNYEAPCYVNFTNIPDYIQISTDGADWPTFLIEFESGASRYGIISFDVYVDDVTFPKSVSYAMLIDGEAGESPYRIEISSTDGFIFHNTPIYTQLEADVYYGSRKLNATEIASVGTIKWYRDTEYSRIVEYDSYEDLPDQSEVSTDAVYYVRDEDAYYIWDTSGLEPEYVAYDLQTVGTGRSIRVSVNDNVASYAAWLEEV